MTFERARLSNYKEFKKPCVVNLGDSRSILAYGKGTYHVTAAVGDHTQNISLQEVLYLPELDKNLLSVNAMYDVLQLSLLKTTSAKFPGTQRF